MDRVNLSAIRLSTLNSLVVTHTFLRNLEEVLINTLEAFDISAQRVEGKTGVWVDNEKIASIGIGVKRWISWHGFALNVNVDLNYLFTNQPM